MDIQALIERSSWSYDDYTFESPDDMRIPGEHPEHGAVEQAFSFIEVVESGTGTVLPDAIISESEWEYDDYEIVDGTELRIHGQHDEYGEVTQALRLKYIWSKEEDRILAELS